MRIRRALVTDENLSALTETIFGLLSAVYEQSPWSENYIRADLQSANAHYLLAENEVGQIIGFLSVSVVMDEMEITNIAVQPDFQGQGIASLLLSALTEFTGTIFLEVRASNAAAQHLYKKFGFETYHVRKNYYDQPREDAILMRKIQ